MIIFDLETTGLTKHKALPIEMQPYIVEFAAVKLDDHTFKTIDELEFMCKPNKPIEPRASKLTGITNKMVEDKPPFIDFLPKVIDFFEGEKKLVAHNIAFDFTVLKYELMRLNALDSFPMPFEKICTMQKTRYLKGKHLNLGLLYHLLCNKKIEGAHRAINDVYALTECVQVLHQKNKI